MRHYSYTNAALRILELHKPGMPLAHTLKQYFSSNKKHGSRDRKIISSLCYCFFRTGKNFMESREEKLVRSLYICDPRNYAATGDDRFEMHEAIGERISTAALDPSLLFSFEGLLSSRVDPLAYAMSMLVQPDLFLRVRPGKTGFVHKALTNAGLVFEGEGDAIRLVNIASLPGEIKPDRDVIIQDLNSQKVFDHLPAPGMPVNVWDCCAASGGKSILLYDRLQANCYLTVTDIRPSIISNLKERFYRAGIKNYRSEVLNAFENIPGEQLDIVICDVPCSGSGTWGRTPEQQYYFKKEQVSEYAALQKKIAGNALRALKPGGFMVYITCSVFKMENEDVVKYILDQSSLQLIDERYLEGYNSKADTMYAAVFSLP